MASLVVLLTMTAMFKSGEDIVLVLLGSFFVSVLASSKDILRRLFRKWQNSNTGPESSPVRTERVEEIKEPAIGWYGAYKRLCTLPVALLRIEMHFEHDLTDEPSQVIHLVTPEMLKRVNDHRINPSFTFEKHQKFTLTVIARLNKERKQKTIHFAARLYEKFSMPEGQRRYFVCSSSHTPSDSIIKFPIINQVPHARLNVSTTGPWISLGDDILELVTLRVEFTKGIAVKPSQGIDCQMMHANHSSIMGKIDGALGGRFEVVTLNVGIIERSDLITPTMTNENKPE